MPAITWQEGQVVGNPTDSPADQPGSVTTGDNADENDNANNNQRNGAGNAMAALANRNRNKDEAKKLIDAVEAAKDSGSSVIVLYVYTKSEDRRLARAKEACEEFERCTLNTLPVAQELQAGCTCIRVEYENIDRDMRSEYGLSTTAPQIVIYDYTGRRLYRLAAPTADELSRKLKSAKEANEQALRRASR